MRLERVSPRTNLFFSQDAKVVSMIIVAILILINDKVASTQHIIVLYALRQLNTCCVVSKKMWIKIQSLYDHYINLSL